MRLERFVGLALVGLALLGAVLMGVAAVFAIRDPVPVEAPSRERVLGVWELMYSTAAPSAGTVIAAAGFGLLLAAAVAVVERRVTTLARTNEDRVRGGRAVSACRWRPSSSWRTPATFTPVPSR